MLNITHHQENTNQNYIDIITSHLSEWLKSTIKETKGVGEHVEKGEPSMHCWWECKMVQPLWKPVWRFLKKLKIDLPYNPATALLHIYPKIQKYEFKGIHGLPSNVYSTIYNSQNTKAAQVSTD